MKTSEEKLFLLKSLEALNDNNRHAYYANLMHLLSVSDFMDTVKPQTLWESEKVATVMELLLKTESVGGDIVELGVFRGGGTILIAEILKRLSSKRKIVGIDSFEGLPEAVEEDADANGNTLYTEGTFKEEASYEFSTLALEVFKVDNYAQFIKGFFKDVFPQLKILNKFSLVIIDPDQYSGTMESLNMFYDHVNPGGYILIDDYYSKAAVGVKKAADEFLADKPESIQPGGRTMAYFQKEA